MSYEEDHKYIKGYVDKLYEAYYRDSRIEKLTNLLEVKKLNNPTSLGKKYRLTNFMLERQTHYVLHRLIQGLNVVETQYIIDKLKDNRSNYVFSKVEPNKKIIDEAIERLDFYHPPDFMIVPISFFVKMHEWGMRMSVPPFGTISYYNGQVHYNYLNTKCRIIWSNKFLKLNEIIIGNSGDGLWQYISDKKTGNRVTIDIEPEGPDGIMLIKNNFEYHPPQSDEISIIEFPEELTKLKEK